MNEYTGWLLDIYPHRESGIVLWFLCDDGQRRCLYQDFPVTFYAAGQVELLRELCYFLKREYPSIDLGRDERRDLFNGPTVVLASQLDSPFALSKLYRRAVDSFPNVAFYDVDIDVALRHAAVYGTFPFARCHVVADEENTIQELHVTDSKWDLDPEPPPLRILNIKPDVDPFHAEPKQILVKAGKNNAKLDIHDPSSLGWLSYLLKQYDPDLILSSYGDTWLLPMLLEWAEKEDRPLPLNRDPDSPITHKDERSYPSYGQIVYRGQQIRLAGRLHIDIGNTVMWDDYELEGVIETARVSSLPIQTAARVSPGTAISSMEIITALQDEILVPLHKEQVEDYQTTTEILELAKGGIIGDPEIGLHTDAAELDFAAMYGSLVVRFNISPETIKTGKPITELAPNLEMFGDAEHLGLIPKTLVPLLDKRGKIKHILPTLNEKDIRYKPYTERASVHKWLVVTSIGYMSFKSARFGCIETHQAILAFSREVMLRSMEAAEELGMTILHAYVDGIWVNKLGCKTPIDFQPLVDEIIARTGLSIILDGVFDWIVFPPSRKDERIPVPNKYFGVFADGEIKTRGIETRRHDTPAFVAETQMEILEILADALSVDQLLNYFPKIDALIRQKISDLRAGRIPPEKLIVRLNVSREKEQYKSPSPVAVALLQLASVGKFLRPGQSVQVIYILGKARARAWDLPEPLDTRTINIPYYRKLLMRAVDTILGPIKTAHKNKVGSLPVFIEPQLVLAGMEHYMN